MVTSNDLFAYAEDSFTSVKMDGDTIAVGSSGDDSTTTGIIHGSDLSSANEAGNQNGAVYVFRRTGTIWSHEAFLKSPSNSINDYFGLYLDIKDEIIAAAAPYEDSNTTTIISGSDLSSTNDAGDSNGAVYVFTRSGSTWSLSTYLKAPNTTNFDAFGNSG